MSTPAEPPMPPVRFPVSVLAERRLARSGPWTEPQWDVLAVVAGEGVGSGEPGRTVVLDEPGRQQFLWSGLEMCLYRDGCESYWHNLVSEGPRLFVICFVDEEAEEEAAELMPVLVTASQDEAGAHMEADDPVFAVPMPEQVHQWVERYVVANYEPEHKKKRRRETWGGERNSETGSRRLH